LQGRFGGQRIGGTPDDQTSSSAIEATRRAFGLPDESSQPQVTSGLARFATALFRELVPGGKALPQLPVARFPAITNEQIDSPEGQEFLRRTEGNPLARGIAFADNVNSLNSLLTLGDAQFKRLFPRPVQPRWR
jgi:hypothetical protein